MKTRPHLLLLLCSLLVLSGSSGLAQTNSFLTVGKHYAVTYLVPEEEASRAHLPRTLTIVSEGPDQWYLIQAADGRDVQSWINFAGVLSFSEMPAGFEPANRTRKITE